MRNNNELLKAISLAQAGDNGAMEAIVNTFEPIIKKYARILTFEDAQSELTLFLIELVLKINANNFSQDSMLVSYISKSIKNKYIVM